MSGTDCDDVLREIEAYLDGEMPEERKAMVVDHLRTCSPCADRADFQQRLKELVASKCQRAGQRIASLRDLSCPTRNAPG